MEYEKGEWFGELALISRQPRGASILALSPVVEVLELPRSTFETFVGRFEDILQRHAGMYAQINEQLASKPPPSDRAGVDEADDAAGGGSGGGQQMPQRQVGRISGSMELLRELQALPGGDFCCDCGSTAPTWASSNTGAFESLGISPSNRLWPDCSTARQCFECRSGPSQGR